MTVWIIEPQDPLIARDGRPFNATPGVRARSLPFPYPSTTAGGVRTRAGQKVNGRFDAKYIHDVEKIKVRGPLLAEINNDDSLTLLAPAPADALLFDKPGNKTARKQLRPLVMPVGGDSNLPDDLEYAVGLPGADPSKPSRDAPKFWRWKAFKEWLLAPTDGFVDLQELGHAGPQADQRTHIAIDPQTLTSLEGMLFMTSGLTFWQNGTADNGKLSDVKRLALVVQADGYSDDLAQTDGFGPLGGERRLMYWYSAGSEHSLPFSKPPKGLADEIARTGHCRLILLTPGLFEAGWLPGYKDRGIKKVKVDITAAVVGKPAVISGWDLEAKGPKPTRRLVPAGSVYYLHLTGTEDDIRAWVKANWMRSVCDNKVDRTAGFGLAALGVEDGIPAKSVRNSRFSDDTAEAVTTNDNLEEG